MLLFGDLATDAPIATLCALSHFDFRVSIARLSEIANRANLSERQHMTSSQALLAIIVSATVAHTQPLRAEPLSFPGGSYEVTARLELPHLERWGVDKTTIICLLNSRGAGEIPVPVVSANNPFAKCSAANLMADGSTLEYDIVCRERGTARGHAVYELSTNAFTGRVAMVMGAKNMTMTEVQHARRIGECSPAKLGSAARF